MVKSAAGTCSALQMRLVKGPAQNVHALMGGCVQSPKGITCVQFLKLDPSALVTSSRPPGLQACPDLCTS